MGQILATGKKSNHGAPELGNVVAYCSAQHRVFCLYRIEHCTLTHRCLDLQVKFAVNPCEGAQVRRGNDANRHSDKSQVPTAKLQGNFKFQCSGPKNTARYRPFGTRDLRFVWDLELEIWSFIL